MSKASNYNHFLQYKDGDYYGYNFLYRSMIKIPQEIYPNVIEFFKNPNTVSSENSDFVSWLEPLRTCKFVIDDTVSEIDIIKHFYYKNLYASDALNLIVLPTLQCNLDCPYCFEYKKPGFMKPEIEDALIQWIDKYYSKKRTIDVAWFGGEPILHREIIYRLTKRIKLLCDKNHSLYSSRITTNGVLMDDEFLSKIPELAIRHVQVTLDGDQSHHDQLRKSCNGKGSFEKIIENVSAFCRLVPDEKCKLTIRINCCDANYDSIDNLFNSIPTEVKSRATLFFRWIFSNKASTDRGYGSFSAQLKGHDYFKCLQTLNAKATALGFHTVDSFISKGFHFCEVDFRDQYTIYPDGKVYLCTLTGADEESLFNITECVVPDSITSKTDSLSYFSRWMTTGPFENKTCLSCKILPLCLGGCRKQRFEGNPNCLEAKSTRDFFVDNAITYKLAKYKNSTLKQTTNA